MSFSPDFVRTILREQFEDAKTLALAPLLAIHYAHLVMLVECGLLARPHAQDIRRALDALDVADLGRAEYDGSAEDLFFYVNRLIAERCGADAAGRLHLARSRNDIDMTVYRMRLREWLLDVADATLGLRRTLVDLAGRHRETVFPAHTHTQPAQPTTLAHYLLGVIEQLERDSDRLAASYERTNRCPLGACALAGTGFRIDRARTAALLGFAGPTGNTYGSIASADYLLEAAAATGVLVVGAGRFAQDLLLWATAEVGYLRLPDGLVQTSSIMPQKRNPAALEHARALGSKAFGQAGAVATVLHNTPFGDIVDGEDDLQPLVASLFRDATRSLTLLAAVVAAAEWDVARMRTRASEGGVTLTELADSLVRVHDVSFAAGHAIAARVAATWHRRPETSAAAALRAAALAVVGRELAVTDDELARWLSPTHFVTVRTTPGGPAPEVTGAALDRSRGLLLAEVETWTERRRRLAAADDERRVATGSI